MRACRDYFTGGTCYNKENGMKLSKIKAFRNTFLTLSPVFPVVIGVSEPTVTCEGLCYALMCPSVPPSFFESL